MIACTPTWQLVAPDGSLLSLFWLTDGDKIDFIADAAAAAFGIIFISSRCAGMQLPQQQAHSPEDQMPYFLDMCCTGLSSSAGSAEREGMRAAATHQACVPPSNDFEVCHHVRMQSQGILAVEKKWVNC